ncbi:ParB family chromosome partitioning protein [Maritalea mobilis]|uniref:ParB family chromosome partitioning protein n=1 Tax=Maritalea mobilis TaxID=483324 RepID=A0A4R6VGM9_9HYPH|nr:plasmid partitioning protein RepB [Maritalea mobilis]TDQ60434.1 ParB family chromosome partitioning protein [Maritalea mobilis]
MSKRKSIVSSFGDLTGDSAKPKAAEPNSDDKQKPPNRVAAGIIGTTQRTLSQLREERDQLLAQAQSADKILKLDPEKIDPSPFQDRLPDDDPAAFEQFKQSMRDEGQQVPITVRLHPQQSDRHQIVYGHRRWRALKELGLPVKAILVDYSDRDLVVAQGIENANRQDLSWIERALFADEMHRAGLKPKDIKAALNVDDAQLSKFRYVIKQVGAHLIQLVGRAPGIGRPRWIELADRLKEGVDEDQLLNTLSDDKVQKNLSPDDRFSLILKLAKPEKPSKSREPSLSLGEVGTMQKGKNEVRIKLKKQHQVEFAEFLESEMEALLEKYSRHRGKS